MKSSVFLLILIGFALLAGFFVSQYSPSMLLSGMAAISIFIGAFINKEFGLYTLIFSMLLSPQYATASVVPGRGRGVTLRMDDLLLFVIGLSWFSKNAIFKELGMFKKSPLNKPIFYYLLACVISTGVGIMAGRVNPKSGFFFVLKYFEYFIVYFMMINYTQDRKQIERFVLCLLATCFITSVIGILQIPKGIRVSAPFEGTEGEPNTFGGYLLFIGAFAAGLFSTSDKLKTKILLALVIVCIMPAFLYTESRSSYLGLIPAVLSLGFLSEKKGLTVALIMICLVVSPLFLPSRVKDRILFTFTQPKETEQLVVGNVGLDTSTSARIISWKYALKGWTKHPIIGNGITGFAFVDAQFPRVLVETGILGLTTFIYLLYSIFKLCTNNLKILKTPYLIGLNRGFFAGYIGLLFHAIGANTFIIVRIMEPFWFVTGIISILPELENLSSE